MSRGRQRILVISQYYYPEPFRVSDVCEELVKRGYDVTVVTGLPNYPMGKIYDGYRHGQKRDEVLNGVKIHRCFTIGRRTGVVWRMLNYYSYVLSSSSYVSGLASDFDTVLVYQLSPVMMAKAGIKYAKKHHKKLMLYCLDLWPESLTQGGVGRGSALYWHYHKVSEKIYRNADKILVTSKCFDEYFDGEFGIKDIEYLPQYAEEFFTPEQCKKEPDGNVDLMFAGNIGITQSVDTIIRAAALTKDIPNLRWHIVGDGSELEHCKNLADEFSVTSVIFHGRKPMEEMPKYYALADVMLVTMRKEPALSMTLPGKVQSYMAAGKPMIGAIDGEASSIIAESGCGVCVPAEDAKALADAVKKIISDGRFTMMGRNAQTFYNTHFGKKICMDNFENQLMLLWQRNVNYESIVN